MKYNHHHQSFESICALNEILNNSEYHYLQIDFFHKNSLNQMLVNFIILSCSAFNSAFVVDVATFLSKSELFMNPVIADSFFLFCYYIKCLTSKFIVISCSNIFGFNV